MLCSRCLNTLKTAIISDHALFNQLKQTLPRLEHQQYASSWKRRMIKQERLKEMVFQYASKNTKRTDRIYVWGNSSTGALGVKSFLKPGKHRQVRGYQFIPYRLDYWEANHIKPKAVSSGFGYTVYLTQHDRMDRVYGCGLNFDSQLGYQEYPRNSGQIRDYLIEPVLIQLPLVKPETTKILHVACGRAHTWIATDQEGIFTLGNNSYGQCGRIIIKDEIYKANQTVNRISFDKNVKQICCGRDHTLILTDDGEVYSCGLGIAGQTGVGHYCPVDRLTKVIGDIEGENIVSLSSRVDTVLVVSDKGQLFGWGSSEFGQLSPAAGDKSQVNISKHLPFKNLGKVIKTAASSSMCAVLNDQSEVFVWGYGILGKGPRLDQCLAPEMIPSTLFGCNELNPDQTVIDIHAGGDHFAANTESGELYMWGKNTAACLGLGNVLDQYFPFKVEVPAEVHQVACGIDHTAVLCKSFA